MPIKKLKEKLKKHFHGVQKTKKSPNQIALGFAIGTLISILPTPGINVLLGILIVILFKKVNKYSLFIAMGLWNFLTLPPIYYLSYELGDYIFESYLVTRFNISYLTVISNYIIRYIIGNVILAIIITPISYILTIIIVKKFYQKKKTKV
ncbi:MAG: DUF2062 domain-containing protein [Nanoarchaeota archaeon]